MTDDHGCAASRPGILVVDDEPMLLSLLEMVLNRRGFQVWTASCGENAIGLYAQHREQIGVVLLDVRMPQLDGPGTLAGLRQVNPSVQACFMSGYPGQYSTEDLFALGALRFFEKPFQIASLADTLWQLAQTAHRQVA